MFARERLRAAARTQFGGQLCAPCESSFLTERQCCVTGEADRDGDLCTGDGRSDCSQD